MFRVTFCLASISFIVAPFLFGVATEEAFATGDVDFFPPPSNFLMGEVLEVFFVGDLMFIPPPFPLSCTLAFIL